MNEKFNNVIILPTKHIYDIPKFNINDNIIKNVTVSEEKMITKISFPKETEEYEVETDVYEPVMGNFISENTNNPNYMEIYLQNVNANLKVTIKFGIHKYIYRDNLDLKEITSSLNCKFDDTFRISIYKIKTEQDNDSIPVFSININTSTNEIKLCNNLGDFKQTLYEKINNINLLGLYGLLLSVKEDENDVNTGKLVFEEELKKINLLYSIGTMIENNKIVVLMGYLKELKIDTYKFELSSSGFFSNDKYIFLGHKLAIKSSYDYVDAKADGEILDIGVLDYQYGDNNYNSYSYTNSNPFITNEIKYNKNGKHISYTEKIANDILDKYKNGKMTGTLQVGYGDYYYAKTDENNNFIMDNNGNIENGELYGGNPYKPKQLLKVGDIVLPMKYINGIDVPMYKTLNGKPRIFEITSAELKTKGVAKLYLEMEEVT